MTSLEEFSSIYSKLVTVFGEYSKNAAGKCAVYHEKLSYIDANLLIKVVEHATSTCKRFPSIAELKEIAFQLNPSSGQQNNTSNSDDQADFQRRMRICNDITSAIQKLPEFQRRAIENKANNTLKANAPDWYTTEMKKRAFQGFCILAFKELHPDHAADIEHNQSPTQNNTQIAPYRPIPFQTPAQKTTMWPSQPTQIVDMDVM